MINKVDFSINCNKGYCAGVSIKSKKCFTESKQLKCYSKYIEKNNKVFVEDKEWSGVVNLLKDRDGDSCRLLKILNIEEYTQVLPEILKNFGSYKEPLDPAHIFKRNTHPELKYDLDNLVLLHRFFHSRIDSYKDPVTGKHLSKEEVAAWWKRIVGVELYNSLVRNCKNED